jgi:hypothetical protein
VSWFRRYRPEPDLHEGAVAKRRTEADSVKAKEMGVEIHRLSASIRQLREQNHFAESIANLLRGQK